VVFEGANQQLSYHRLFGGQLLGQFIRAACLTCPDKTVKSLHAVFAREGRCFGRGDVISDDGSLVASYAQEALLRFREAADHLDS
jgi:acyl-CoA thioesterase